MLFMYSLKAFSEIISTNERTHILQLWQFKGFHFNDNCKITELYGKICLLGRHCASFSRYRIYARNYFGIICHTLMTISLGRTTRYKTIFLKKYPTQITSHKPCPISGQNGHSLYPISNQQGSKNVPYLLNEAPPPIKHRTQLSAAYESENIKERRS